MKSKYLFVMVMLLAVLIGLFFYAKNSSTTPFESTLQLQPLKNETATETIDQAQKDVLNLSS